MARLLGLEAAAVFPSGTMAQQIALRIHCEARGADTIAFHRPAIWSCTSMPAISICTVCAPNSSATATG